MKKRKRYECFSIEDEPEWQFLATYVTGKHMHYDLAQLTPDWRESLSNLKSIFLDQKLCKLVMAGSVMLWLDLGQPTTWFPGDIDVFVLENANPSDQKDDQKSAYSRLVCWLEERKWIKVDAHSVLNPRNANPPSLSSEFASERWICPLDETRSINIVHILSKLNHIDMDFDSLMLAKRFDIPACGRTWPKTHEMEQCSDKKIHMWPVRDDPFSYTRVQKYRNRIGQHLVIHTEKLATTSYKGQKLSVRHMRQPIYTHNLGIGPSIFHIRNRHFADNKSGPYCFRDLYRTDSDNCDVPYTWQPDLFGKRCTDRKCGSLIWEDAYAWHIHGESELVVAHCLNRLEDEENHRELFAKQTQITEVVTYFLPEIAREVFEFFDYEELVKLIWPCLVTNCLPSSWQKFINTNWMVGRLQSIYLLAHDKYLAYLQHSSFSRKMSTHTELDSFLLNSTPITTKQLSFWIFLIQQLAFNEHVILRCPNDSGLITDFLTTVKLQNKKFIVSHNWWLHFYRTYFKRLLPGLFV